MPWFAVMLRITTIAASPRRRLLLAAALLLAGVLLLAHQGPAHATLVKCRGAQGRVVYQDAPCLPGTELRNLDTDPATLSVVPGLPPQPLAADTGRTTRAPRQHTPAPGRRAMERAVGEGRAAERRFIRTGMTEAEVIRRIGKPEVDSTSRRKQGKTAKLWSYVPAAGDPDTVTTITLAGGLVTAVDRKIVR